MLANIYLRYLFQTFFICHFLKCHVNSYNFFVDYYVPVGHFSGKLKQCKNEQENIKLNN